MMKKRIKKLQAWMLSIAVFASVLIAECQPLTVYAATGVRTMNLDTTYLAPSDGRWDANDHKVWFGQYGNTPTAFRVLKAEGTTMMLDCDTILLMKAFDEDFSANTEQNSGDVNEWTGSDLEKWLNGTDYYGNTSVFTSGEQSVIQQTSLLASASDYDVNGCLYKDYAANDYIYLLSAQEANNLYADDTARVKTGGKAYWWLRSAYASNGDDNGAGIVYSAGDIIGFTVASISPGVSPSLNLNLASVIFASANEVSKSSDTLTAITDGSGTKEWKLTLLDSSKSVEVTNGSSVSQTGNTITVPYTYAGSNVDQISVMITTGAYNEPGTEIIYYGKLNTTDSLSGSSGSGTGIFTLPSGLPAGYKIYILAEDVNEAQYTDYASAPVEIAPHTHTWDTDWTSDDTHHWHKCTATGCDGTVSDKAAHTESAWLIDKEATTTAEGAKHTECTVCKKVMQTGTIPKIEVPDEGDTEEADTEYSMIEGANQTIRENYDGTITITCNGELSEFVSVSVDGMKVDSKNYTVKSGSTILTFTKEYVDSLTVGTHTIRFEYTNGSAETNLTVEKADNTPEVSPKTGDNTSVVWLFVLCLLSGAALILNEVVRRKRV